MISRKYRIHAILIVTFLFIVIYPQYSRQPDEAKTTASTTAALEFLQLIDSGQIENSWLISAEYLRNSVPLVDWKIKLTKMRTDYGTIVERERAAASFTALAEDLPDSDVIILTFDSKFENQEDASETVTLLLVPDSGWRVVGYFIK